MKRILLWALLVLLLAAGAAVLLPGPIEPQAWTPPRAPAADGVYAPNSQLQAIEKLAADAGAGPEGVSLDREGGVIAGYLDGRVVRLDPASGQVRELGNTGGRPLGTAVGPDGTIFVADAIKGLLELRDGQVRVLTTSANGLPFRFVDDVDVSADGNFLYFTDASARFGIHELMHDVFEHGGTGRLLRYDRRSGETVVLLDRLYFPNGVALGPAEAYVLVNETQTYRILRYWLKGANLGRVDVLIDNLPGIPDNLSFNGRDRFWVALYSPRIAALDAALPHPWLRKLLLRLPAALHPKPAMEARLLALDLEGKVVAYPQYQGADVYAPITSVEQADDVLYLGSLSYPAFGRVRLPGAPGP